MKEVKDEIVKALTGKLTEIADAVVKEIGEKPTEKPAETPVTPPAEKPVETPAVVPAVENEVLTKSLADLSAKVEELTKKLNEKPVETPAETTDLEKKQSEIKAGMVELVKAMGIDTNNVDVDFVIKEKKKGTVVAEDNTPEDADEDEDDGDSLSKELSELEPEQKKEALDHYFKSMIFPKKS